MSLLSGEAFENSYILSTQLAAWIISVERAVMLKLNNLGRNSSLTEGINLNWANWTTVSWDAIKRLKYFIGWLGNLSTHTINSSTFNINHWDPWLLAAGFTWNHY